MPPVAVVGFSAEKLITAREDAGWSRAELAVATGLSWYTIEGYERKDHNPSRSSLAKLSRALGIPRSALLDAQPVRRSRSCV